MKSFDWIDPRIARGIVEGVGYYEYLQALKRLAKTVADVPREERNNLDLRQEAARELAIINHFTTTRDQSPFEVVDEQLRLPMQEGGSMPSLWREVDIINQSHKDYYPDETRAELAGASAEGGRPGGCEEGY